ncbi:hypothetical protein TI03_06595 [Achromatium sp. WMS1]|nr:hypothetical protein TI03_06595 [Achromatium sp. WMS1]
MATNTKFSIITFAEQFLAFPYQEIIGITRTLTLEPATIKLPFILGNIVQNGKRWPVFSIDAQFMLISHIQHPYCICLSADHATTGLALICDTIDHVNLQSEPRPIPPCIQHPYSPLRQWYWYNETILAITNVQTLQNYIISQIQKHATT